MSATATFDGVLFQESNFGWTATGPIPSQTSCNVLFNFLTTKNVQDDLVKFWEVEEVLPTKNFEPEHQLCEKHFENSFSRDINGRFIVRLPLKKSPSTLGASRNRAFRSLIYGEKRQDTELCCQYIDFMKEYLDLGHK